jgi:O-antigen/teichoic acid export membrane protein
LLPRNALHNLSAFALPVFVSLVTTPYIVGRLGPETFGLYMLVLSLVSFGGLFDFGLASAAVRGVAEARATADPGGVGRMVNATLVSRLPVILVLVPPGLALAPFLVRSFLAVPIELQSDAVFVLRTGFLTLGVSLLGGTLAVLPRAANRFDVSSRLSLVFSLLLTSATVALLMAGRGLRQIATAELALAVLYLLIAWRVSRRLLPDWVPGFRVDLGTLRELLQFGAFVSLGSLAWLIFLHAHRLLIGRLLGVAAVAYVTVPWGISSRVTQVVSALCEATGPAATALWAQGQRDRLRELSEHSTRVSVVVAAGLTVPVCLGGPDFLLVWMGKAFASESGPALRMLALAAGLQALTSAPYYLLNSIGRVRLANVVVFLTALGSVPLSAFLIPRLGLAGFGWSMLGAVAMQLVVLAASLDKAVPGAGRALGVASFKGVVACSCVLVPGCLMLPLMKAGPFRLILVTSAGLVAVELLLLALNLYKVRDVNAYLGSRINPRPD